MNEKNGNEKNVNEKNVNEKNEKAKTEKKKKSRVKGEKRFYLITAISCAVVLVAIVVIAAVVSGSNNVQGMTNPHSSSSAPAGSSPTDDSSDSGLGGSDSSDDGSSDKPVGGETEGMAMPVATVTVGNDYGFYHNQTLNNYYEHTGVDFMVEVGAEVFAVEDGVVESIYKDDLLLGTEIVVAHDNGVKSVYRFVNEKEGLKVGDQVSKGEAIATVAEPTGNEYKDGAHLHFEIKANGVSVDPTTYLTLEEK